MDRIPQHVSIIMDGNGRWAKARGKERVFGHREGAESVRAVLKAAARAGVKYLSLYAFSEENWGRPESEVSALMSLMAESMRKELPSLMENGVRFLVLGNRSRFSESMLRAIDQTMAATAANTRITLILFLSYSGKWDLLQAMKKAAASLSPEAFQALEPQALDSYLVTAGIPDPDLLIRTSGEVRLSNYLLWQSAYTEFYFTDVLWPDFRDEAFQDALDEYARRDRRYGKVK
ncbi:MAG: di-trans,poly-cis-decaprenylcistransferase [Bacteroidales bacterium]|nr:di-trans,poly-cis-decaprenylcistransferase [Bacteroidales bacterium]